MIISPGRNYIFVHSPKTGGTSLATALESRALKDDILIGDTPKAWRRRHRLKGAKAAGRLWKHSMLSDIEGMVSKEFIANAFITMMVRNPWDRLVSYYHWLQTQNFDHPAVEAAHALNFESFLQDKTIEVSFRSSPYTRYVTTSDGVMRCNTFIRLEHFETDSETLWAHLGFRLDLPHENKSPRKQCYREYYTDKTADLVAEICAHDIARFKYTY